MRILAFALPLLIVLPVNAQQIQLVGFTSTTSNGNLGGTFGATQTCQSEPFEGSRMCTTLEVLDTVVIPVALAGEAWVRPVSNGLGDVSGISSVPSCSFWSSIGGSGLAVTAKGAVVVRVCTTSTLSIACCAPVP